MPASFDEYAKHFREAQDAWTRLHVALDQLATMVGQTRENPGILGGPFQAWPTQQELHQMFADAQNKTAPLMAEYSQLPQDTKVYAPKPGTVSQHPAMRR